MFHMGVRPFRTARAAYNRADLTIMLQNGVRLGPYEILGPLGAGPSTPRMATT